MYKKQLKPTGLLVYFYMTNRHVGWPDQQLCTLDDDDDDALTLNIGHSDTAAIAISSINYCYLLYEYSLTSTRECCCYYVVKKLLWF